MGSGKTTLLHNLALKSRLENWSLRVEWLREPVARYSAKEGCFSRALERFYAGELSAFAFQSFVHQELLVRDIHCQQLVLAAEKARKPVGAVVMDRHTSSCIAFSNVLHLRGALANFELQLILRQCNLFDVQGGGEGWGFSNSEATLIYLDVDEHLALERIQQRQRAGEQHISLEYLTLLRDEQHSSFSRYKAVHKVVVTPQTTAEAVAHIVANIINKAL